MELVNPSQPLNYPSKEHVSVRGGETIPCSCQWFLAFPGTMARQKGSRLPRTMDQVQDRYPNMYSLIFTTTQEDGYFHVTDKDVGRQRCQNSDKQGQTSRSTALVSSQTPSPISWRVGTQCHVKDNGEDEDMQCPCAFYFTRPMPSVIPVSAERGCFLKGAHLATLGL